MMVQFKILHWRRKFQLGWTAPGEDAESAAPTALHASCVGTQRSRAGLISAAPLALDRDESAHFGPVRRRLSPRYALRRKSFYREDAEGAERNLRRSKSCGLGSDERRLWFACCSSAGCNRVAEELW
jgi:hypothetical protein